MAMSVALLAGAPVPALATPATTTTSGPGAPSPRWASRSEWQWPLAGEPELVRAFRAPAQPWLAGHRGVDLAASPGAQVRAPAAGVVVFTGVVVDRGVLVLAHPGGLRTSYEPVTDGAAVGTVVARGDPVARVGTGQPHCPVRVCLHWGVRRGEVYLDPMGLLRRPDPPVLLPLTGAGHGAAQFQGRWESAMRVGLVPSAPTTYHRVGLQSGG